LSYAPARSRSRAPWLAFLLVPLLALAGILVPATAASAAPGDVTGATLNWGFKQSFRNYIGSVGQVTGTGVTTATAPYGWSGGTGSAADGTGAVSYPGSLHFQGHKGTGVPAEEYALDILISDVRVAVVSATAAELRADVVSRNMSTQEFEMYSDVVIASLNLAEGTDASTATTVAYTDVPATLTAAGAPAFSNYPAGDTLDPVSFSWSVEQAPAPEPEPEPEFGITVSPNSDLEDGDTVTITGAFPATITATTGPNAGTELTTGVYVMYCDEPTGTIGTASGRLSGGACDSSKQLSLASGPGTQGGTVAGTVTDGIWTFTATLEVTERAGNSGIFTRLYHGFNAGNVANPYLYDQFAPITFAEATPEPEFGITVTPNSDLEDGDTVTVTGTFPATITADTGDASGTALPTSVYVMYCDQPTEPVGTADGRPTGDDCVGSGQFLSSVSQYGGMIPAAGSITDGIWTFTADVTVDADSGKGIFTRLAHTFSADNLANQYIYDQFVALDYAAPAAPEFGISVSPNSDLEDGDTVTVTGTFPATITATVGPNAGTELVTGVYVMYCDEPTGTVGTAGGRLSGGACDSSKQLSLASGPGTQGGTVAGTVTDGIWTFTATLEVTERAGNSGIFTRLYHGFNAGNVANPYLYDQFAPIAFATVPGGGNGPGTEDSGTVPAPAAGSLAWGIKGAFRTYITGPIAGGSISASGVTASGGSFVFPQSSTPNLSNGLGTVDYSGTVRFTGHHGALDLRFSNPQVRIDSSSSGTLFLTANGSRVAFATLNLASAQRVAAEDGSIRYSNVRATLTAAGASAFDGYYGAGEALDSLAFTIGSPSSASGGTVVVASAASTTPANTPDPTPPATDGIDISGNVVAGGEVTATADGFQPNESGILVVVYSTPTVLADNLTADANGVATWTGKLPRDLSGQHTLTFQGSVDRGVVLNIRAATQLQCVVDDATLTWGFKESFRAYIDGSIANGEWTVAGDASYATPLFTFANGSGGTDLEAGDVDVSFGGSITFTGHGGVLNTTIANPQFVVDGDEATLFVDVTGTTRDGVEVSRIGIEFVTLDLAGVEATRDGNTVTWADVPTTLTDTGHSAFGTYPAGEAFDPLTLSIEVAEDCGEAPVAAPEATEDAVEVEQVSSEWPLWATIAIIAGLLLLALVVALLIVRARRQAA
jgi:hypothetical protein